ncbi:hypothetical protein SAMN05421874_12815 [Nonomuraea maritima]|uniref:Uncharacterized protein n=1 Tax=Nonomuraea maritima TaxID=683260 RepID=A0A1G9MFL8_9ACTN|nr:hypothetical protein [Nonomuraea maritima]SDL72893.1 hypothetical protein SAMN05421874_12815 [Nonomuraea maritima]
MDNPQSFAVPLEPYALVVAAQRNEALDQAAQWQAVAVQRTAERDELRAELERLRAETNAQAPHA